MNSFDHMVMALAIQKNAIEIAKYSTPTIEVALNPNNIKISKTDYKDFYKEFIFDKLKSKTLAECFSHKFGISDILFQISMSDEETQKYIEQYYIK
jgi:hypothetical protein